MLKKLVFGSAEEIRNAPLLKKQKLLKLFKVFLGNSNGYDNKQICQALNIERKFVTRGIKIVSESQIIQKFDAFDEVGFDCIKDLMESIENHFNIQLR
jgi:hypothetical protein